MPKYNVGDYVIYGVNGACEIIEIGPLSFGGPDKIYYSMKLVSDSRSTIYLPLTKEDEIIRYVISAKEAEVIISKIASVKIYNVQTTKEVCDPIIKTGDLLKIAGLVKYFRQVRVENKKLHKGLNIQEEKMLRIAETVIYSELSIALNLSIEEIASKYSELFD